MTSEAPKRLTAPTGLSAGGRKLWTAVTSEHTLDITQQVTLTEACRAKDRLDKLDQLLRGDIDTWVRLTHRTQTEDYELKIDQAMAAANTTANLMKQLLAALRLPDAESGKRPQARGGGRGAYQPKGTGSPTAGPARISSIDRARQRAAGS